MTGRYGVVFPLQKLELHAQHLGRRLHFPPAEHASLRVPQGCDAGGFRNGLLHDAHHVKPPVEDSDVRRLA
jgi:hypothetical protein